MKLKRVLTLAVAILLINVAAVSGQNRPNNKHKPVTKEEIRRSEPHKSEPRYSSHYKGSSSSSFATWARRAMSDELKMLKRAGVRCRGSIEVNYEVLPDGRVFPLSHYDTGAAGNRGVDGKINDAINRVLRNQRWDVHGWREKRRFSFIAPY